MPVTDELAHSSAPSAPEPREHRKPDLRAEFLKAFFSASLRLRVKEEIPHA
jgi:hypothetical protein